MARTPDREEAHKSREKANQEPRDQDFRRPHTRFTEQEIQTLKTIAVFRTVEQKEIPTARIARLEADGLVERKTVYPRPGAAKINILIATKAGKIFLMGQQAPGDRQRYHHGLVKPRELAHDAAIYPAFRDAAAKIENAGGKVKRIVLDYELKGVTAKEMNSGEFVSGAPRDQKRAQLAADLDLTIVNEKFVLPDLRIEYEDADGREQHEDLEITTRHYKGGQIAAKQKAGFTMVPQNGPRSPVQDDHHHAWMPHS